MNRMVGILVVLSSLAGCDPGPEMLEECQEALANIPTELPDEGLTLEPGPWEVALRKCQMLATSDSDLAPKGTEIIKDLDSRKAGFEQTLVKRREEHEIALRKAEVTRKAKEKVDAENRTKETAACGEKCQQEWAECSAIRIMQGGTGESCNGPRYECHQACKK